MERLTAFLQELKRRKVFQVTSIYLVTAWGASVGGAELLPAFGAPEWVVRVIVIGFLIFLPVVIGLAWYFEMTSTGIVRDPVDVDAQAARAAPTVIGGAAGQGPTTIEVTWEDAGNNHNRRFIHSFSIGRDAGCEVTTLDPLASRRHVRLEVRNGKWWIVDCQSSNGTILNGMRIDEQPVPPIAQVQLGPGGQEYRIAILDHSATTVVAQPPRRPS